MQMDEYTVSEGGGVVEVCAQLSMTSDGSLECGVVVTLQTMDGDKASMSLLPPVC